MWDLRQINGTALSAFFSFFLERLWLMPLFSGMFDLWKMDWLVRCRPRARPEEMLQSVWDHLKAVRCVTSQQLPFFVAFIILPIDTMTKRLTVTAASQPINLACSINLGNRIPQMWQTYDPTRWLKDFACPCDTFKWPCGNLFRDNAWKK